MKYKIFLIFHIVGAFFLGGIPILFLSLIVDGERYSDLFMVLGAIIIMLVSYRYCQEDRLLSVGWKVIDVD